MRSSVENEDGADGDNVDDTKSQMRFKKRQKSKRKTVKKTLKTGDKDSNKKTTSPNGKKNLNNDFRQRINITVTHNDQPYGG